MKMTGREDFGEVQVLNEVIAHIVRRTSREVEGVVGIAGGFSLKKFGIKDVDKGIEIKTEGNTCDITIDVKIEYGLPIYDVARNLQKRITDSVEQMTNLRVNSVNVRITGLAESGDIEPQVIEHEVDVEAPEEEEV
jgi:uncharacterized alkaline shock family protein YloU